MDGALDGMTLGGNANARRLTETHNPGLEMAHRRKSDRSVRPVIVTTDDGTRWRCSVGAIGRETEPRWILIDGDGAQYVGPVVLPDKSPETVKRLVEEWWAARKAGRTDST